MGACVYIYSFYDVTVLNIIIGLPYARPFSGDYVSERVGTPTVNFKQRWSWEFVLDVDRWRVDKMDTKTAKRMPRPSAPKEKLPEPEYFPLAVLAGQSSRQGQLEQPSRVQQSISKTGAFLGFPTSGEELKVSSHSQDTVTAVCTPRSTRK